ncbi:MAG: von Willebrand factor type A domain-containing protein [Deltaproteobacteria bacterium]
MSNSKRLLWVLTLGLAAAACSTGNSDDRDSAAFGTGSGGSGPTAAYDSAYGPSPAPGAANVGAPAVSANSSQSLTPASGGNTASVQPEAPQSASDGDRYQSVGTNPFVMVAHDPLSTFGADVDTASYDIFRRDVNLSSLPDRESVRLEEYINSFHYDYPAAAHDAPEPFSIALAAAQNPLRPGTTLLRVGIQGKNAPPEEPKPANLVFLVDVSGSMQAADRLPLAQQVLRQTLDLLQPTDTVSIVSYASDTRVRLAPTPVSERATIVGNIDGLTAGGSTAGASGIDLAYAQAQAGFLQSGINHIILCTDGDFNVGRSSNAELLDLIREKRRSGVTLTALGFGAGNLNDSMLEAVSNAGNGFYGVISSEAQAADYVQRRMLSTLTLIAKDVKIQVEFNAQQVAAFRLLGYENRAIADQDFRNDIVDAGEIGSGHQVTALYELVLAGGALPETAGAPAALDGAAYDGAREVAAEDLVLVKIRYKQPDAGTTDPALEVSSRLAPAAIASTGSELERDLDWAISLAAFAEILAASPYASLAHLSDLESTFLAQRERDADRAEFLELFTRARSQLPSRCPACPAM